MTANEWLEVMKQAQDFPKGMEKLIVKYGEMLIAEHKSKVKKLTIPDVINRRELLIDFLNYHLENDLEGMEANWIGQTVDNFLKIN